VNDLAIEQAWARAAQAGSHQDFSRLVAAHQGALRAFLRRLCANAAEADDLAQETFVFVWEKIVRFDPAREFRPWLFAIAWRKYRQSKRSWLRRLRREQAAAPMEDSFTPDPGLRLDLRAALSGLAPEPRAAVLLCLGCDFSHGEAAQALEIPLGTVKSHIARARETLQAALGEAHA
jgi:RNA polymerase sigma-70 factor (ECF subfamily)